ncbi:hypothetical protein CTI12_AA201230 [Artemisia annua]|uniref:Uncharacterized protein n=1 Tax=Artemisia annua TaxID=35608 RepID=A0A2U1P2S0_ARTAN|nr:hypothetical protein CTI12_AA201230 [Artemisia annua]
MCKGANHSECKYESAFNAVQMQKKQVKSSSAKASAIRRFSSEKNPEKKDQKRIRELEKTQNMLHLIMWGPK